MMNNIIYIKYGLENLHLIELKVKIIEKSRVRQIKLRMVWRMMLEVYIAS